jgi:hypothetical protein
MTFLQKGDLVRHRSVDFQLRVLRVCGSEVECLEAYGRSERVFRFPAHEVTRIPRPLPAC